MSSMMKKVLMIDNYDSFTYNLVHYIEEIGPKVTIKRNDTINIKEIIKIHSLRKYKLFLEKHVSTLFGHF